MMNAVFWDASRSGHFICFNSSVAQKKDTQNSLGCLIYYLLQWHQNLLIVFGGRKEEERRQKPIPDSANFSWMWVCTHWVCSTQATSHPFYQRNSKLLKLLFLKNPWFVEFHPECKMLGTDKENWPSVTITAEKAPPAEQQNEVFAPRWTFNTFILTSFMDL